MRTTSLLLLLTACGRPPPVAPPSLHEELSEGRRASIAGIELPRMPIEVNRREPPLRDGWSATARSLTMRAPRPPLGEAWEVEAWADDELADWLGRRGDAIAQAQRALEPARQGDPEASVVASTLLGLAYARFAMDVRGLDTPRAFADDARRAREYREALETAAQPLWLRALDAFGGCAATASAQPAHHLDRWRERCDDESREASAMLPGSDED